MITPVNQIKSVCAHQVGNKTLGEDLMISTTGLDLSSIEIKNVLTEYFLTHFRDIREFYQFTFSNSNVQLNPVYSFISKIFADPRCIHEESINISRFLYDQSMHPNIKPGDFYVAYFDQINLESQSIDCVGMFKAETKSSFLQLSVHKDKVRLNVDQGTPVDKLDKGCLVFNIDGESGYKVAIIDRANRSEAQYWKDQFLNLKELTDDFHYTQNLLSMTKSFVTKQLPVEFDLEKTDQMDLLDRSIKYFKSREHFNEKEFSEEIFKDLDLAESFERYKDEYRGFPERSSPPPSFDIHQEAVKKQSRFFKSVLKLDKNFHVYIHGDRNKIVKGVDETGRKFYKLYYDEER